MKKFKRIIISVLAFVMLGSSAAFAAKANVTYIGNASNVVCAPGSKYSLTDLFPNFKEVMPGAELTQKITVRNNADDRVKVRIYLRSHGTTSEEFVPFLEQLTLSVQKESDTPMFLATPDIPAGLTDWVCLGTLYSGGEVDLNVTLSVPKELDNQYQDLYGELVWEFMVEELPVSPYDPVPKTGDPADLTLWIVLAAASATGLCVLFLISRKKRKERTDN